MPPSVKVIATLPESENALAVYERVTRFGDYAAHCPDVREVVVHPAEPDGTVLSDWTVNFRGGVMRWQERDTFDPVALVSEFDQVHGDLNVFRGQWRVSQRADGVLVEFTAAYDVGIASLAGFLNPVAGRAIAENITSILTSLFGAEIEVSSHDASVA